MFTAEQIVKPKTQSGKRYFVKVGPKLIENDKCAIFIRGVNANSIALQALKDFAAIKKPHSVFFNKKNDMKPFENISSLEFFSKKNDASLFMFGSHNKKRPNNIVIGRTFDQQLLDMFEFGIENFKSLQDFKVPKISLGTKPILVFTGDMFEKDPVYLRIKNLFMDFFRGPVVQQVSVEGFKHVLMFSENKEKIQLRSYKICYNTLDMNKADIGLTEIGPRMDLSLRRTKIASHDLFKVACKQPKELKPRKVKNIKRDPLGTTHGRVHMVRQDYGKLQTRKLKGLKRNPIPKKDSGEKRKMEESSENSKKAKA